MPAHEQQPQDVVSIRTLVEAFRSQVVAGVEEGIILRQGLGGGAAALGVECRIAPDHYQPGRGVSGRALLRPGLQSPQAGFLKSLLSCVQIAEVPQQGRNGLRPSP